jgi:uncharacterized membrane protein YdjX (TVP38/TMEM64 family)
MIYKSIVFFIYGIGIVAIIANKEWLLSWLSHGGGVEHLLWMIGAAIFLAMVPVVPFGVIAGIMGAQYGPVWGTLINVVISTIAAVLLFLAARVLFQEQGRKLLSRSNRMDRFMLLLERNAFMAVLTARLLPFVPSPAVNVAAAISRMTFGSFVLATVIGKIPVMFVFAIIGNQLASSLSRVLWTLLIYLLFLLIVYVGYRWYHLARLNHQNDIGDE